MVAGRYRLHELLGQGGMGAVWRATDELLGRTVAIKQVRLDGLVPAEAALARERTMREARIAAALHHPHVVTVFDVVVDRGEPWLVMEYVPAPTLGRLLAERGALHPAEVATIGAQVAAALTAAHAAGIVHRDVKPDNILVTASAGGQPTVKLTDFGISHAATVPVLTATGVLTGTPAYFAPEVARGEDTDDRSDVYSLGATLYAAVDGHPPFGSGDGNLLGLLARIGRGAPPPPRQAGLLTGLLLHLIADVPASRPTAVQAQHALQDMAGTMGPIAPTRTIAAPRRPRRPLVLAAVGLVAAVAAVATVVVVGSGDPARPAAPPSAAAAPAVAAAGPLAAEHTADSCSLLDRQVLERFGSTTIDPDNARFRECVAFVVYQRIEVLRVDVYGPGPTTCAHAAELATIAGSRLDAA
jgi:eukaryotic-like serine/threonine-protein kinase